MGDHSTPLLLGAEEVAEILRVPVSTLYQWRHKGYGPEAVRVGRHLRYRRDAVFAWLDSLARAS